MTDLAAGISGGLKASELGGGVAGFAKKMKAAAGKNVTALLEKTGAANAVRKLDKALFDSGKLAEESRTKKRKQNAADLNNKSAMSRSGDKAVSDYKKKNAKELMGMTAEQQRDKLKGVRDSAMNAEGKKLGLNDDQIKALKSDKGLKYVDTNVFGAVLQAGRQAMMKGGSLNKSIEDRDVKTKFSHGESQTAMKQMTSAERKQFVDAAKQGKVEIGKSKTDALLSNKGRLALAIGSGGLSEAARAAGKGVGKAKKFFHDKDYDDASKQLENEGLIDKNSVGWSRSDSDKKLIRERRKENMQQKKANTTQPKSSAIAELEREEKYLNEQEAIDESDSGAIMKGVKGLGKYIGRGIDKVRPGVRGKYQNKARNDARKGTRDRLGSELADIKSEQKDLGESRDDAMAAIQESDDELKESPLYNQMTDLDDKIKAGDGVSGDDAKLARLQKEVKADEKLSAAMANKNKATIAVHQIDSQLENLKQKSGPLQSFASAMDDAAEIRNQAIEDQVINSSNSEMKDAYSEVSSPEELDQFVGKYGDEIFTGKAADINDQYSQLREPEDYNSFIKKNSSSSSSSMI